MNRHRDRNLSETKKKKPDAQPRKKKKRICHQSTLFPLSPFVGLATSSAFLPTPRHQLTSSHISQKLVLRHAALDKKSRLSSRAFGHFLRQLALVVVGTVPVSVSRCLARLELRGKPHIVVVFAQHRQDRDVAAHLFLGHAFSNLATSPRVWPELAGNKVAGFVAMAAMIAPGSAFIVAKVV